MPALFELVRSAIRTLLHAPLFSGIVVALLAMGIGANTLVFTAIDALLLKPLPVDQPERLARLGLRRSPALVSFDHPYLYCRALKRQGRSFSHVFASWPTEMALASEGRIESISGETVSGNYFEALGLSAAKGRLLTSADERQESPVAILGHGFSEREFGARDPIGNIIRVRGQAFTVVGVAPPRFTGLDLDKRTDVWVTMAAGKLWASRPDISRTPAQIYVRLERGVSLPRAEAEVRALFPGMAAEDFAGISTLSRDALEREQALKPSLDPVEYGVSSMRKTFSSAVRALMTAVVALLFLACANAGGLMVARGQTRMREMAIRLSLGATRWHLLWRAVSEAAMLSIAGAAGGWIIAWAGGPILLGFLPHRRPMGVQLAPDARVLAFGIFACAFTAALLSVLPAWQALRSNAAAVLNRTSTRVTDRGVSRGLVALQVAVATALALGGFSLVRTLDALRKQDPGFRRDRIVVMTVNPRMAGLKSDQLPQAFREIARRTGAIPGVIAVSAAERALMRGVGFKASAGVAGSRLAFADAMNISMNGVSENYFADLGMRIVEGRGLMAGDNKSTPRRTVVSQEFAKRFFPGTSPIGRAFGFGRPGTVAPPTNEIVGVVNDAKYRTMREAPPPTVYSLLDYEDLEFSDGIALHVVARSDPESLIESLRSVLGAIGPGLAPADVATMEQEIETSLWQERLLAALSSAFAIVAVVLAGIGLFGTLAYAVSRRTREIGIRVALGATVRRIAGMVLRDAASSIAPGLALGFGLYFFFSRALTGLLFGIGAWDPASVACAAGAVIALSAAAAIGPALRATAIQPSEALRNE